MTVVAIIPARNERESVADTVRAAAGIPGVDRVLVVDDASEDDTADAAGIAGAEVLRLPRNVGKGSALEAGVDAVDDADAVLLLDADLGETADDGRLLLAPILADQADMAVAVLPKPPGSGGFGLVKGLARFGIRRLGGGFYASSPLSGQRALSAAALRSARPFANGYGAEVALTIRILRAGLTVIEVPTSMGHRATGRDLAGFAHRGRQFVDVARALLSLAAERR